MKDFFQKILEISGKKLFCERFRELLFSKNNVDPPPTPGGGPGMGAPGMEGGPNFGIHPQPETGWHGPGLNKSCLSSFCTVKNFALGFATKTGTAATFSITLVSNFVKRKAFPKRFCHNDNNNSGNMFRGIDTALTIFMMRHKLQR